MVEKVIRDTYSPLQSRIVGFSLNWDGFNLLLSDKKVLSKQIQELEKENDNLRLENQVLREEAAEVKRLRGLLDFKAQNLNTFDLLAARVIARSPNNWHETVTIDKGEKNGIKKDMPVISPDGLVGRIESVGNNSSRVSLISAWDMAVGAILQETRDTKGIIEGIGDARSLRMVNIPYYALVKNNDQVITSGLSKIYPKGINIGTVSKVIKEPDGLLLSAYVTPFVDFDKLEEVLVITCYHADENNLDVQGDN
jgi:rod shape-determining protein MreC